MFRLCCALVGFFLACTISNISNAYADEPVRRAFLVGIERYGDGIQPLNRAVDDAKDLGHDLEQIGFEKKNITVVTDIRTKADFNKKFEAFLKTVHEGDLVFFFFSGHGIGVEATNTNYLLFGDLRSPFAFTKDQLPAANRKDSNVVKLQVTSYLDAYERDEIPKAGISAKEIEQKLAERKPKTAIIVLDACRSILAIDPNKSRKAKRDSNSGSRLVPDKDLPDGFMVLYSASFGEQAVERFGKWDQRRNSLFTEVLRSELPRPGQSLIELAERVRLMVRDVARNYGQQQEPEQYSKEGEVDDVYLVGSIGAEQFAMTQEKCEGAQSDWEQISLLPRRENLERHIHRFDGCPTAEEARRKLVTFAEGSDNSAAQPSALVNRPIDPCDRLAASENDRARPPEVPGVAFEKITADDAIAAC